jgi:hypothetical protein
MEGDPVIQFNRLTISMVRPLTDLLRIADPAEFDRKFSEIEPTFNEWRTAFGAVDNTSRSALDAIKRILGVFAPLVKAVNEHSKAIGATKGQKLQIAPSAGGYRKNTRRRSNRKTRGRRRSTRRGRRSGY